MTKRQSKRNPNHKQGTRTQRRQQRIRPQAPSAQPSPAKATPPLVQPSPAKATPPLVQPSPAWTPPLVQPLVATPPTRHRPSWQMPGWMRGGLARFQGCGWRMIIAIVTIIVLVCAAFGIAWVGTHAAAPNGVPPTPTLTHQTPTPTPTHQAPTPTPTRCGKIDPTTGEC